MVLRISESVDVACSPDGLYDMVSDVTRMGEWSPVCRVCWWDPGDGPIVGQWFSGRNVNAERVWVTRCQVTVADPGREFSFTVNGTQVRWAYAFDPIAGGTRVTETWELLPDGLAVFAARWGDTTPEEVAVRRERARTGMVETLAAIKRAAELTAGG